MGMSVGGGSGSVKSDINVTPLVDVVLVLLIIFLVTMPVLMRTVTLEVPRKATDAEDTSTLQLPVVLKVMADGTVELNDGEVEHKVSELELTKHVREALDKKTEKVVFVDFEDEVSWARVVETMDRIRAINPPPRGDEPATAPPPKVALKRRDVKLDGPDDGDADDAP